MKTEVKFGGSLLKGKRKSARPLSTKKSIHLVLKADRSGLGRNRKLIDSKFQKAAQRWGIRIYRLAVEKDHVHAILKIPTRQAYRNFIQRVSGAIALRLKIKWLFRPFTRIIEWGKAFKRVCAYVEMNALEAAGSSLSSQANVHICLALSDQGSTSTRTTRHPPNARYTSSPIHKSSFRMVARLD